MILLFTYAGRERTLTKSAAVRARLKRGEIRESDARLCPWYLRLHLPEGERWVRLPVRDADAIRAARDLLKGREQRPDLFTAWCEEREARRGLTVGQLVSDWLAAGLPHSKTKPRTPAQAERLRATVLRAVEWWCAVTLSSITPSTHEDYVAHRQQNKQRGTGERSADLELSALSSCCQWGVATARIPENPFESRQTFATVRRHCSEASPANDEELHRILAWFFEADDLHLKILGGYLAYSALSGQRAGEPTKLFKLPILDARPSDLRNVPPGTIYPLGNGTLCLRIARFKSGQNPGVKIHPVLESFLTAWRAFHAQHLRDEEKLFPLYSDTSTLNRAVNRACAALGIPRYTPYGVGRAYYVKVRRSQGITDPEIAMELGQTSNGKLIRSTYGSPDDIFGSGLFDWLPADTAPAWSLLVENRSRQTNAQHETALP